MCEEIKRKGVKLRGSRCGRKKDRSEIVGYLEEKLRWARRDWW